MSNTISTLTEIKQYAGLQSAQVLDDDLLLRLSDTALSFMQTFTGRKILSATYTNETYNGNDSYALSLLNFPITAVASVTVDQLAILAAPNSSSYGFVFDLDMLYLRGYRFCRGIQNIVVTYTAGYSTIPDDWKSAHIELVVSKYKQKDHIDLTSVTTGGLTTTAYIMKDVPMAVQSVMNRYRRVAGMNG